MMWVCVWIGLQVRKKKTNEIEKKIPLCLMCSCLFKWDLLSLSQTQYSLWSLGLEWDWEWKCNEMRVVRVFLGASSLLVTWNLRILSFSHKFANCFLDHFTQSLPITLSNHSQVSVLSLSSCCFHCPSPLLLSDVWSK